MFSKSPKTGTSLPIGINNLMKSLILKIVRYLLLEIRSWFFIIVGFVGAITIPAAFSNLFLGILVFLLFVALYLVALFYTGRLSK